MGPKATFTGFCASSGAPTDVVPLAVQHWSVFRLDWDLEASPEAELVPVHNRCQTHLASLTSSAVRSRPPLNSNEGVKMVPRQLGFDTWLLEAPLPHSQSSWCSPEYLVSRSKSLFTRWDPPKSRSVLIVVATLNRPDGTDDASGDRPPMRSGKFF